MSAIPSRDDIRAMQEILAYVGADPGPVDGLYGQMTMQALYEARAMVRSGSTLRTSPEGVFAIATHEGIVPGPYLDSVGVWTYGIGHTAAAGPPIPAQMRRGMPGAGYLDAAVRDAVRLFRRDLDRYEAAVRAVLPNVAQHEFDAAVSFHYNTGAIGTATWAKHLARGERDEAARTIMNWRNPAAVIPRREAERDLLANGTYPRGSATVWGVTGAGKVIWEPVKVIGKDDFLEMMV